MPRKSNNVSATDAQWKFASVYIRTGSKMQAMLEAYPGYKDKRVMQQRALAERTLKAKGTQYALKELRNDAQTAERLTIHDHMAELREIRDRAKDDHKWTAALNAEVKRGQCMGFYIERTMNMSVITSMDEFNAQLVALFEQQPRLAKEIARFAGQDPVLKIESHPTSSQEEIIAQSEEGEALEVIESTSELQETQQ